MIITGLHCYRERLDDQASRCVCMLTRIRRHPIPIPILIYFLVSDKRFHLRRLTVSPY